MFQWCLAVVCLSLSVYGQDDWDLIFSDEFDGPEIDLSVWEHEITAGGGGNAEFQVYTPDPVNSYIQDGKLFIKPTMLADNINPQTGEPYGEEFLRSGVLDLEELYGECNVPDFFGCYRTGGDIPPIASGRVRSNQKFSFRYGKAEVFAKMPVGDWTWPALWLLPDKWYYGGWPMSGEIDMVEAIGNRNFKCDGVFKGIQHVGATLHWGVDWTENRYYLTSQGFNDDDHNFGDNFHKYGLIWTPNGMKFYLDDELFQTIPSPMIDERDSTNCFTGFYEFGSPWGGNHGDPWTTDKSCDQPMAPFDQDMHFIFNVAVGGTNGFIPDGCSNMDGEAGRQKPWVNNVGQAEGMWNFYNARESWEDTWTNEGDNLAMQVDWVRVYQPSEGFGTTDIPAGCPTDSGPRNCPAP